MLNQLEMDKKVTLQIKHEQKLGQYPCDKPHLNIPHQLLGQLLVYTILVSFVDPTGLEPVTY